MPEKILGIDIGKETIKAVQVTAGLKKYQVINSALIVIEKVGGIREAIKWLFEDDTFKSGIYITSLPVKNFSFRNIRLPFKDKKKISQTIPYELEPYIPYPINDVLIDHVIVELSDQSEIFAAATEKSSVGELVNLLGENQIEASIIDVAPVPVVFKLLTMEISPDIPSIKGEECGLLLDIGDRDTAGVLFKGNKILNIRHYTFGGEKITETLSEVLDVEFHEAEKKKRLGDTDEAEEEISKVCRKFFVEVKNTTEFLKLTGDLETAPSKIFLTGGGALYPFSKKEMGDFFAIPVEEVDVSAIDNIQLPEEIKKSWNPMLMNQALALATREAKKADGFNFALGKFGPKRKYEKFIKDFRWIGALVFAVLLFWGIDFYMDYHYDRNYLNEVKQEITTVFKKTCPEVTRIVDPVQQLKIKIEETRRSSMGLSGIGSRVTVLNILKDISRLVPESVDFLIKSFSFDGVSVDIKGETDHFNTVDSIKNSLGKSDYFKNVKISSANLIKKDSRVGFNLKIELK